MQTNNQIVSAVIIAGVLIAGAILLKDSKPRELSQQNQIPPANEIDFSNLDIKPISTEDHISGNINADLIVLEYSDTECPFCKIFHETMHKILQEKENVAWIYRHYPISGLHPKASREAEATECAFEQEGNEGFWKYIDRLFAITPSNNQLEDQELTNIAQYVGLNTSSFYICLESGKYKNKVEADVVDGNKAGVGKFGTPFSLILKNGEIVDMIRGAQPYEKVLQQLEYWSN
jgi:protein-disulfide isomerase